MLPAFLVTLFVSSSLLFLIQPMFGRMVLPLLGGSPAVWNTCMLFFQACLLGGYLYAHVLTRGLRPRGQAVVHIAVLLAAALMLPLSVDDRWVPPAEGNRVGWLLLLLAVSVGLPFFAVSASAPLLQRWFNQSGHTASDDPYFLYAASNVGSMLALLAYPAIIEPTLRLHEQSWLWTGGYALLIALSSVCAAILWRRAGSRTASAVASHESMLDEFRDLKAIPPARWLRWIGLAFVPSSLMLAVTTYITTDLVVMPLLWVIPLAIYLLTFVFVFARRRPIPHVWMVRALPAAVLVFMLLLLSEATEPIWVILIGHLACFFILAMVCHGEMANDRPDPRQLTIFYLMMGVGGMLGGLFNAVIAPIIFTTLSEYPLAVVLACLLGPAVIMLPSPGTAGTDSMLKTGGGRSGTMPAFRDWRWTDAIWPVVIGTGTFALIRIAQTTGMEVGPERLAMTVGLPAVACYLLSRRTLRFALAVGAVFLISGIDDAYRGHQLYAERSFFGIHRITQVSQRDAMGEVHTFNRLFHGTTLHGKQHVDPESNRPIRPETPLAYYVRSGPLGSLMELYGSDNISEVGIVGLGVGAMAAYAQPGDRYTFFEIDPSVKRIAEDERFFSYLSAAKERGASLEVVLGDARLTVGDVEDGRFELLVLDAFSSDAIPVHLLTREAIELYFDKLADGGIIAFHISNRYLDLAPVLANISRARGSLCLVHDDAFKQAEDRAEIGRHGSTWAILVRDEGDLQPLRATQRGALWIREPGDPDARIWTDDYSHILGAFRR